MTEAPVAIAVLTLNKLSLLKACLESLFAHTDVPHRVCVLNQASTDGTRKYLDGLGRRIDVIHSQENLGFIRGNNLIMRRYPTQDIVLLNDDTVVTPGWLRALRDLAYSAPDVGIVGAKLVYPNGVLQEAGGEIFRDGTGRNIGKWDDAGRLIYNQVREVDYCSGACLYIRRAVLDRVGGLDERYLPAYFEDSDLCFAAAEAGFKVLYQPAAVILHHEGATNGSGHEARSRSRALQEQNRPKFVAKWAHVLATKRRHAYELPVRPGRDRLLFIGPFVPMHDRASGELRWFLTVKELARDFDIVYVGRNVIEARYIRDLEEFGVTVFAPDPERLKLLGHDVPAPPLDLPALLGSNDFLAVVVGFHQVAHQYAPLIQAHAPRACFIVDTHDIHYLREWRKAELADDDRLFWEAEEEKRRELGVYRRADLILTVTEQDRQALLADAPDLEVRLASNIHDPVPDDCGLRIADGGLGGRAEIPREGLVFVGNFNHPPNGDAMVWFCGEVFPRITARLPDVKLYIVGNMPTPEVERLAGPNVVVTGYVPSTLPYLQRCRISIAPLRYGAGMKGKVGEALAAGIPVVTTTAGAEGMGLEDGRQALIADGAEAFAEAVIRLYGDEGLRGRLAAEGRRLIEARYGSATVGRQWRETLDRAREIAAEKAKAPGRMANIQCPTTNERQGGMANDEWPMSNGDGTGNGKSVRLEPVAARPMLGRGREPGPRPAGYTWLAPRPRLVPDLSIVILSYNTRKYTEWAVASIRKNTGVPFEIVLVDNGSTDGTAAWADADHVRCIANPTNLGFAPAVNQGIRASHGRQVILLNNDVLVTPRWAERMLAHLERDRQVGMVGPSTNFAASAQCIQADYKKIEDLFAFSERLARQHRGQAEVVQKLIGFCMLIPRRVIEEVGLLDERFGLGSFEDDDYCLRVRQAGYDLLWAKDAYVHHFGHQTYQANGMDWQALIEQNKRLFEEKWSIRRYFEVPAPDAAAPASAGRPARPEPAPVPEPAARRATAVRQGLEAAAAHAAAGDEAAALGQYEAVLAVEPDQPEATHNLAMLRYRRGEGEEAKASLRALVAREPGFFEAHRSLGLIGLQEQDFAGALEAFRGCLRANVDCQEAYHGARLAAERLGQPLQDGETDLVFYAGGLPFDGRTAAERGLGGSESAVAFLARELARLGYRVRVFCNCERPGEYDGVWYGDLVDFHLFRAFNPMKVFISSRSPKPFRLPLQAVVRILWVHDAPDVEFMQDVRLAELGLTKVFALSAWQRDEYARRHGLGPEAFFLTRNGVDLETWGTTGGDAAGRRRGKLIYASRPSRGLDVLLACLPRIRAAAPEAELHVFSYDYPERERDLAPLRDRLAQPGVVWRGSLPQPELAREMREGWLLTYPSTFPETACMAAIQAQAAGLPAVVSGGAALPETVAHEASGLVIPGDPRRAEFQARFVETVARLIHDEAAWRRLSAGAAARARERYGWPRIAREWAAEIERLFAESVAALEAAGAAAPAGQR